MSEAPLTAKLPPPGWILFGLFLLYLVPGLFGHDPWKNDDVVHLLVAHELLQSNALAPLSFTGKPFLAPPLYYWSTNLTGWLFGGFLATHDALRLASGLWTGITLLALFFAAREWYGREYRYAAPLLLAGSIGLIVRAHEGQPLLVLMAAVALQLLATSLLSKKAGYSAALTGIALILSVLGAGLPGFLLFIALLSAILLLQRPTLDGSALRTISLAVLGALFLLLIIGWGLYRLDPAWLQAWLAQELGLPTRPDSYLAGLRELTALLPWFSWPLLPLGGWSLWFRRREWQTPGLLIPLASFLVLVLLLPLVMGGKEPVAIVLLPPLALLATPGTLNLRRGAANAFDWFSGMAFSLFCIFLWLGWSAMYFGWPERLAHRVDVLSPGFSATPQGLPLLIALVATGVWIWLLTLPRSPYRCLVRWSAGLTTAWVLLIALWLPLIDYVKTYRPIATTLIQKTSLSPSAPKAACIAEQGLGDAQEASFAYFAHLRFIPLKQKESASCKWLLVQGPPKGGFIPAGDTWKKVWEGNRPGDRRERFRLYRRID